MPNPSQKLAYISFCQLLGYWDLLIQLTFDQFLMMFLLDRFLSAGQTVDVSNGDDAEIPNEPLKSKSKTKSKKGASKATPRKKESR